MSEPFERLQAARLAAGYETATDAANAMGVVLATYIHHENGTNGLSRAGERYARFFGVRLEWLLAGRGEMTTRTGNEDGVTIPIHGLVGAGAAVEMTPSPDYIDHTDEFQMPGMGNIAGLIIRGDSQMPRFRDGEMVLFDPRPVQPDALVNKYAIVQTLDGRRLIKILRRGKGTGKWRLDSHNADPEEDVQLLGAWRYLGVMQRS